MVGRRTMMARRDALRMAQRWRAIGGQARVDIGALEPLLWRENTARIPDLVGDLVRDGHEVRMTTNASRLERYAQALAETGLTALRISWHTTSPTKFKVLSGGHGDYVAFMRGLRAAVVEGLPVTINRLLLRETLDELPEQLDFAERHGLTIKLYDLLWTPAVANGYKSRYVACEEAITRYVVPRAMSEGQTQRGAIRKRERWVLDGGGAVEVKRGREIERDDMPCRMCAAKKGCLEAFGEYIRLTPDRRVYFCYLRRDLGFEAGPLLNADEKKGAEQLRIRLSEVLGDEGRMDAAIAGATLRLTVSNACNFHCALPGTLRSWCLEESMETIMPPIRRMTSDGEGEWKQNRG